MVHNKEIPQWIIDYDQKAFTSSAGKAVRELMDVIKNRDEQIQDLKRDLSDCKSRSRMGIKPHEFGGL